MKDCPCSSKKPYALCCEPFHKGTFPVTALELMRSRFSAYALNLPEYIIETTHPGSPGYLEDKAKWCEEIAAFSSETTFEGLEILGSQEKEHLAMITFVAHLKQNGKDATFTEKSYFERLRGKWHYRAGQLMDGHAPNLVTTNQLRILPLAYYGNPILRKKGDPILKITDSVIKLAEEMIETMDACDGLGLAAPQVHYSLQMFVIRKPIEDDMGHVSLGDARVFINPKISDPSAEQWTVSEGCLSIPAIHGDVERPEEITVEYMNLKGEQIKERCSGWEARVIMHENDHLQGVLFIDYLSKKKRAKIEPFLKRMSQRIRDGTEL